MVKKYSFDFFPSDRLCALIVQTTTYAAVSPSRHYFSIKLRR